MRPHAEHGRRGGFGSRGARASRAALLVAVTGGGLTLLASPALAPAATKVKTVAIRDTADDGPDGGIDVERVQLGLGDDGRLRAAITLADALDPADMLSSTGPPGSICLRLWTLTKPVGIPPDFMVCVTAEKDGKTLDGTIAAEQVNAQPKKIGTASVSRASSRTLVIKFGRSQVGSPKKTIEFAAEATKRGCTRVSCVDVAPDAPKTATLTLSTTSG